MQIKGSCEPTREYKCLDPPVSKTFASLTPHPLHPIPYPPLPLCHPHGWGRWPLHITGSMSTGLSLSKMFCFSHHHPFCPISHPPLPSTLSPWVRRVTITYHRFNVNSRSIKGVQFGPPAIIRSLPFVYSRVIKECNITTCSNNHYCNLAQC